MKMMSRPGARLWAKRAARDVDPERDNAGVIAPPPLVFAVGLGLAAALERVLPRPAFPEGERRGRRIGFLLLGLGLGLFAATLLTMRRYRTTVHPNRPVATLLTGGPYRISRNPIYLGDVLLYAGAALLLNSRWAFDLLSLVLFVINKGVIDREERYLTRRFGDDYRAYQAKVRRWL